MKWKKDQASTSKSSSHFAKTLLPQDDVGFKSAKSVLPQENDVEQIEDKPLSQDTDSHNVSNLSITSSKVKQEKSLSDVIKATDAETTECIGDDINTIAMT